MSLPKVYLDARVLGSASHSFARYVTRLAQGLGRLREQGSLAYEPCFLVSKELSEERVREKLGGFLVSRVAASFLDPREMLELPIALKRAGAALYHSPTFSSLPYSPCPWIVTVHDLNHLSYGGLKQKLYYDALLKRFIRGAAQAVTVSKFSRHEIARWARVSPERIEVAYNALEPEGDPGRAAKSASSLGGSLWGLKPRGYFLCVSNPKPHKNVQVLVEAYLSYRASVGESALPLVLTFSGFEERKGIRLVPPKSDEEVRLLMEGACALFFPSLYEGFGMPPLEAAALGTPIALSSITPHREALEELGPDEALWLDPRDRAGWSRAFQEAAQGALRAPSAESRRKLRERYSETRLATTMDRIYRRVLEERA